MNIGPLGRQVINEQEEWAQFVQRYLGPGAWLVYVSTLDTDRRIYRFGDRIAKVVRLRGEGKRLSRWYGQTLEHEYRVLSHLNERGIRSSPMLNGVPGWQVLEMDFVAGQGFSAAWGARGLLGKLTLLWATAAALNRVHRCGVWHGDLSSANVSVDRGGRVALLDWGDASFQAPFAATMNEYARIMFGRHRLLQRVARRVALRMVPSSAAIYRRIKLRHQPPFAMNIADEATAAPFRADLEILERGWARAARWNSGEGRWLAYPCLTLLGVHFDGARSWPLRWNRITEVVDFRNKAVVDLGCNLGILTTFSMIAGARSATGVEADAELIDAARDVAAAFGVPATFLQKDLGSTESWEDDVAGADLVVAMNIMEWVSDRPRLLKFIGLHKEVLYEGHEALGVECERLRSVGFGHIELVTVSDLGRAVLYGRQA